MSEVSRTGRSVLNAGVGIGTQALLIGISFLTRTVFVAQLGTDLLGLQTLLLSVLAMLAVADLGLNGALMFALYEPLHDGESGRIAAIVRYGAILYRWVAAAVAGAGLVLLPFLQLLTDLNRDVTLLRAYFLIMLADTVAAYLMAHRVVLLNADQRMYIVKTFSLVFSLLRGVVQVFVLVVVGSFLWFLVVQVVCTLLNNAYLFWRAGRMYPYLARADSLEGRERRTIRRSVRSMLVYRVGGIILHNTDPLIISLVIGTTALGLYANYMLLVGSVAMLIEAVFLALSPSVGQLLVSRNRARAKRVFDELTLLSTAVYGFVALGLVATLNEFVSMWLGADFVLGPAVVAALALNVYVVGTMAPVWAFRGATGMFHETQYIFLITAVLNVILSVVFGRLLGIPGVLFATAAARLVTGSWYEPWVLLARHLDGSFRSYAGRQAGAFGMWLGLGAIALGMQYELEAPLSIFATGLLLVISPLICWTAYRRNEALHALVFRVSSLLRYREAESSRRYKSRHSRATRRRRPLRLGDRILNILLRALGRNDATGHADDNTIVGNILYNDAVRSYRDVTPNSDRADDLGSGPEVDIISNGGDAPRGAAVSHADCDALGQVAVSPDHRVSIHDDCP